MGYSVVLQSNPRILFCGDNKSYPYLPDMYTFRPPARRMDGICIRYGLS